MNYNQDETRNNGDFVQSTKRRLSKQGLNNDLYEFVIGAYLTSRHNILIADGEMAQVALPKLTTIRRVHQLIRAVYPERAISYGAVRVMIAKGRERNPAVFVLAEGRHMLAKVLESQKASGVIFTLAESVPPDLRRQARVSEVPVDLQTHLAAQHAFMYEVTRELARLRAVFDDKVRQAGRGILVLNPWTKSWEWRP